MSKKNLLRRIEELERRVLSLECRPNPCWPMTEPYRITFDPDSSGNPLPQSGYRITCSESVSHD